MAGIQNELEGVRKAALPRRTPVREIAPHLSAHEVACHCGCGFDTLTAGIIVLWTEIRARVGAPIHINSGCRCPAHNIAAGGKSRSRHLIGDALDLAVPVGWSSAQFGALCNDLVGQRGGVGFGKGFVHVDARGERRRWSY